MGLRLFRKRRAIGLDIGSGSVKALCLELRGKDVVVAGRALRPVDPAADPRQLAQAIHAALATAGGAGEPVVAAVGGPDVVIRQIALPPLPNQKILPALELQHRELGLLPPGDAVLDAQVLRRAHDGVSNDVLSVSVPRARIDERMRLLELAAVDVQILDVEPLALLNGAMHLTALDHGELLVLLTVGRLRSVLCLYSEQGPVVARYLSAGAETFLDQLRMSFDWNEDAVQAHTRVLSPAQAAARRGRLPGHRRAHRRGRAPVADLLSHGVRPREPAALRDRRIDSICPTSADGLPIGSGSARRSS